MLTDPIVTQSVREMEIHERLTNLPPGEDPLLRLFLPVTSKKTIGPASSDPFDFTD